MCTSSEGQGARTFLWACLSSCAAFLRRCRRLLPMSAAGSALWNHHTSPARCCSASAAALCSPSSAAAPQPPASAAPDPTSRRYALPPSRTPASPSSPRRPPPSPPRRRRRRHRRRRLLFRAPLVFIESKQASWRRQVQVQPAQLYITRPNLYKSKPNGQWWCTPLIPALSRQRQVDLLGV